MRKKKGIVSTKVISYYKAQQAILAGKGKESKRKRRKRKRKAQGKKNGQFTRVFIRVNLEEGEKLVVIRKRKKK